MSISRIDVQSGSLQGTPEVLTFSPAPNAGDVILVFVSSADNGSAHVTPTGYTLLGTVRANSGYGSRTSAYAKVSLGTELTVSCAGTGQFKNISATAILYRSSLGTLAYSALSTTSSIVSGNHITAPTLLDVPTGAVSVAAAGFYANSHNPGTNSISGSGWSERSDENTDDDTFAGRWNHATASNTSGTGTVTGATFTITTAGGYATAVSLYLYEPSATRKSKLMLGI